MSNKDPNRCGIPDVGAGNTFSCMTALCSKTMCLETSKHSGGNRRLMNVTPMLMAVIQE